MITNLLCTISVLLSTNEATHWPQKPVGITNNPAWEQFQKQYAGSLIVPAIYIPPTITIFADDTNADTKSVETTVTQERRLQFALDGRVFDLLLTNWTQEHFRVEYRRVRTNQWFKAGMDADGLVSDLQGALQISHQWDDNKRLEVLLLKSTNWFEPVATNRNFAQGYNFTNTMTFQPMVVTNSNGTNYPLGVRWPIK